MMRERVLRLCLVALALCLLPAPLLAQTVSGTLQGIVTDTTGGALPGVAITIRNTETGFVREVVTNEKGFYNARFLPIGRYRVTATMAGFGKVVRDRVEVRLNDTLDVDFKLDPMIREEVTVVADRPPINTSTSEVKQSLTSEQILEKPTFLGLNPTQTFLTLAETFAGFQENPTSGQNNPTLSSGSSVNFNGAGSRGTTFQIDGVNNDDSSENQNRQGVTLASIKEFQVISNTYSAEFGRGFGAVVLVQTKSGTNEIHGELFYGRQDSDWNARAFFATTKPINQRPNYGGVVGFPIVKDKLHGFASFERGVRDGYGTYTRDVFVASDFTRPRLSRGNDTAANRAWQDSILARFGDLKPNDPFNRSNRTYVGTVGFDQPVWDTSLRVDWDPKQADHVVFRYQYSRQTLDNEDIIVGETTQQNNRQANMGVTWTHLFSPRTVGEFRYGIGVRDTNVNIKAGNDTPIVRFTGSPVSGSIIGNAGGFPIVRDQMDHQFVYNLSTLFGNNHNLKVGTDIRLSALDDQAQNYNRPYWTFSSTCQGVSYGSPYAAFWDGCVTTLWKGYGPYFLENRLNEYNFYVEDNWKVTPNLTLNLGVRYEYVGAPTEKEDRIDYGFKDDTNNVVPRAGFAWAPQWKDGILGKLTGGPGNFSIRGGYGLFHGRIFQSAFSQQGASLRGNPPYALFLTYTSTSPAANMLNVSDPTLGFVFTPGPQTTRHSETLAAPDLGMPRTHQWNLTVERKLPWKSTLRLTYSGSRGRGLLRYVPQNLAVTPAQGGIVVVNHPNNAPPAGTPDLRGVKIDKVAADWRCAGTGFIPGQGVNATCPVPVPIANNEISLRVPRTNERRPDPNYTTNLYVTNDANTWYDGLQVEWLKRVSHGLRFEATYTFSKALDDNSELTFVGTGDSNAQGPNKAYAKAYGRFHTPHRFTFNTTYLLPIFRDRKDWVGRAFGGWQLSAVVKLAHGTPFTITDSGVSDLNWDGYGDPRPVLLDLSLLGKTINDVNKSQQQLPTSAFRRATPEDYGVDQIGRNTFFMDGVRNVDLGIFKAFRLVRGHQLSVRVEMYNAFNRTQFTFPNVDFASTNFGRITNQQNSARQIQGTIRYIF